MSQENSQTREQKEGHVRTREANEWGTLTNWKVQWEGPGESEQDNSDVMTLKQQWTDIILELDNDLLSVRDNLQYGNITCPDWWKCQYAYLYHSFCTPSPLFAFQMDPVIGVHSPHFFCIIYELTIELLALCSAADYPFAQPRAWGKQCCLRVHWQSFQ